MLFNKDFIGHKPNLSYDFLGGDSLEIFNENLKLMPDNWYYRDRPISYNINEFGHRSISTKELDFNNYILFIGCSHTFGIGLELEKTFPYIVSQALDIPYYNLALGGTGIDVLFYNLTMWLNKFSKPKLIVIQWPQIQRFVLNNNLERDILNTIGSWCLDDEKIKNFYNVALDIPYFETKTLLYYKLILAMCKDIPLIQFEFVPFLGKICSSVLTLNPPFKEKARDDAHFGIKSNNYFAKVILQQYNEIKYE